VNLESFRAYLKDSRGSGEKDLQFGSKGGAILEYWRAKD
jgi:hypothetical protein